MNPFGNIIAQGDARLGLRRAMRLWDSGRTAYALLLTAERLSVEHAAVGEYHHETGMPSGDAFVQSLLPDGLLRDVPLAVDGILAAPHHESELVLGLRQENDAVMSEEDSPLLGHPHLFVASSSLYLCLLCFLSYCASQKL